MSLTQADRESIVSTVQSLLREGDSTKDAHKNLVSKEGAQFWKAQDFLVMKAIEEAQDEELERRFSELVPRNTILVDKLNKELNWIQSSDLAARLKAAKSIDKEVLGVLTGERSLWCSFRQCHGVNTRVTNPSVRWYNPTCIPRFHCKHWRRPTATRNLSIGFGGRVRSQANISVTSIQG